jgi:hypothetical protein
MQENNSIKKELIDSIERDSSILSKLKLNKRQLMTEFMLNINLLQQQWNMPDKEDSHGAQKA